MALSQSTNGVHTPVLRRSLREGPDLARASWPKPQRGGPIVVSDTTDDVVEAWLHAYYASEASSGAELVWQTPEGEFLRRARSHLRRGDLKEAARQVQRGLKYHPGSQALARLEIALAPPCPRRVERHPINRQAERDWLKENRRYYSGKWVALLGGDLLAEGEDFASVLKEARAKSPPASPLILRVP